MGLRRVARSVRELIGGMAVTEPIQQVKAEFFKALAHPARIRVLELLSEGEHSVSELVEDVGLESSHLSQQLGVLRRANLVHTRKEGSSVVYSLADRRVVKILQLAKEILLSYLTNTADLLSDVR
jgi:DNA-binding transcriptional ArsR family regulator